MTDTLTLSLKEGHSLALNALTACGCHQDQAHAVADNMILAERDRSHSHGLFRLPGYLNGLKNGHINKHPLPSVSLTTPSVIILNGDHAMAPYAFNTICDTLVESTLKNGCTLLALRAIHHFSSLWIETSFLAEKGLAALACTSYLPSVASSGAQKVFGTNPMAFAWPRLHNEPLVFDQASAVMARGDIMIAEQKHQQLPLGVGVDKDGKPSQNPSDILQGAQLAFGGYKGANIAMMIELLAGPLIGETTSLEAAKSAPKDGSPPSGGEFILAINPAIFGDRNTTDTYAENMFNTILSTPNAKLPGDRRYKNRTETEKNGFSLSKTLHEKIITLSNPPSS